MYKVKLTPYRAKLGTIFHRQTPGHKLLSRDGRYKFYIDEECKDPDFWVVQGKGVRQGESCRVAPENTILLTTEPSSVLIYPQKYIDQFGLICTCQEKTKHDNLVLGPAILPWFIGYKEDSDENVIECSLDYDSLRTMPTPDKQKPLSVITSNKSFTQGHIDRMLFVEKLKAYFGDNIDVYGRGINDFEDKWEVLSQYKYHIVIENSSQSYYWTEKMGDCLLSETFPFYYGCTNMADYIPKGSFIPIDIKQPEQAIAIIEKAIREDVYENSKEILHESKMLMLDKYNMFEYIASLCDSLDASMPKKDVTILPCKSSGDRRNLWRYTLGRSLYDLKWKFLHR